MKPNKSVVITGVSRGLGRAMTAEFIAHGYIVTGCCRSADAVEELRAQHHAPSTAKSVAPSGRQAFGLPHSR